MVADEPCHFHDESFTPISLAHSQDTFLTRRRFDVILGEIQNTHLRTSLDIIVTKEAPPDSICCFEIFSFPVTIIPHGLSPDPRKNEPATRVR